MMNFKKHSCRCWGKSLWWQFARYFAQTPHCLVCVCVCVCVCARACTHTHTFIYMQNIGMADWVRDDEKVSPYIYVDDAVSIKGSRTSHVSWEDVTKVTPGILPQQNLINSKLFNLKHHIIQSRWHSPISNVELCVLFNAFNLKYSFCLIGSYITVRWCWKSWIISNRVKLQ